VGFGGGTHAPVSTQAEFLSLELVDCGPFRGPQVFSFARPPAGGRCGLTVVTGGGGKGKSSLISALRLALWGGPHLDAEHSRRYLGGLSPFVTDRRRYINAAALRSASPEAWLRLTLRVHAGDGAAKTLRITRSLRAFADGSMTETSWLETAEAGEEPRQVDELYEECLAALLTRDRMSPLFADSEQATTLAGLAAGDRRRREGAMREVIALTGGRSLDPWRDASPAVIELGNRLLACSSEAGEVRLLPEPAGPSCPEANLVVPGVCVSHEPSGATQLSCIGSALVVGLHSSDETQAPLVLDAPMNGMRPDQNVVFLEALSELVHGQVVIAAHEEQIDDLALSLWDRAQRIYLVERPKDAYTSLLSEPIAG